MSAARLTPTALPLPRLYSAPEPRHLHLVAEPDDATLLAEIAAGRTDSFQRFYGRHAGRVLSYAQKLCGDAVLAEDLAQEVFLTVWRKAAGFQADRGDGPGWLYTITRNKVLDHWRRCGRTPPIADLDLTLLEAVPRGIGSELKVSLEKAMSGLRDEHRSALDLAYFGGFSYEETARKLGLPLGTLKSRIRAALGLLREALET